eukprot:TRINITY_DN13458_c0_g1_i1.p1 TRINITY_DN13458_c0_g1~~TRINITY_DN13458_c0_g1_i1.p1  ORF type:complete len:569 (+),score=120.20 TRINITY_DN13458_c0_g1_i1:88-1707(+)
MLRSLVGSEMCIRDRVYEDHDSFLYNPPSTSSTTTTTSTASTTIAVTTPIAGQSATPFQHVISLLKSSDGKSEVSPTGLLFAMRLIQNVAKRQEEKDKSLSLLLELFKTVNPPGVGGVEDTSATAGNSDPPISLLGVLVRTLHPDYLKMLSFWPVTPTASCHHATSTTGGGSKVAASPVATLVLAVSNVVSLALVSPLVAEASQERVIYDIHQLLYREGLVANLVTAFDYLPQSEARACWGTPLSLLTRLAVGSQHFARSFVDAGGLDSARIKRFLTVTPAAEKDKDGKEIKAAADKDGGTGEGKVPSAVVADALTILSQLARPSKDHYQALHDANLLDKLRAILKHGDNALKAKCCTFVGNLCKHSPFFYETLHKNGVIDDIIFCCSPENDPTVKKFAVFAAGNAAFHNAVLYTPLKAAIPYIVALLKNSDEKSRLNAAGAVSNLLRNGHGLCGALVQAGTVDETIRMLLHDTLALRKISLITLGSFAAYDDGKDKLVKIGFGATLAKEEAGILAFTKNDANVVKYISRIKQRLGISE